MRSQWLYDEDEYEYAESSYGVEYAFYEYDGVVYYYSYETADGPWEEPEKEELIIVDRDNLQDQGGRDLDVIETFGLMDEWYLGKLQME